MKGILKNVLNSPQTLYRTLPNSIHNPIIIIHSVTQCHIFMNKLPSYALKAHSDDCQV